MQVKHSKYLLVLFIWSLAVLISAGVSLADTPLYSALPNQSGGSDLNANVLADDVIFASPKQITQIKFWSLQNNPADYAGSIQWSINSDAAGVPGASVTSGVASPVATPTGNSGWGMNEFSYEFAVNELLPSGTYWVLLHNGPTTTIPTTDFFWGWSADTGNSVYRDIVGETPWTSNFTEFAMELRGNDVGSVPEPGTIVLLSVGVVSLWYVRARHKN